MPPLRQAAHGQSDLSAKPIMPKARTGRLPKIGEILVQWGQNGLPKTLPKTLGEGGQKSLPKSWSLPCLTGSKNGGHYFAHFLLARKRAGKRWARFYLPFLDPLRQGFGQGFELSSGRL